MATGPFAPIIAYGRAVSDVTDAALGAGTNEITCNGHAFAVGNHIFASTAADASYQYLGDVLSVATNTFRTRWTTAAALGASAKVWTPSQSYKLSMSANARWRTARETGVRSLVSPGGDPYRIREATAYEAVELSFRNAPRADVAGVKAFLRDQRDDGLSLMTLAYYDHLTQAPKCSIVQIDAPTIEGSIDGFDDQFWQYALTFIISTADGYQDA